MQPESKTKELHILVETKTDLSNTFFSYVSAVLMEFELATCSL